MRRSLKRPIHSSQRELGALVRIQEVVTAMATHSKTCCLNWGLAGCSAQTCKRDHLQMVAECPVAGGR